MRSSTRDLLPLSTPPRAMLSVATGVVHRTRAGTRRPLCGTRAAGLVQTPAGVDCRRCRRLDPLEDVEGVRAWLARCAEVAGEGSPGLPARWDLGTLGEMVDLLIRLALRYHTGDLGRTARALDVSPLDLHHRCRRWGQSEGRRGRVDE